MEFEELQQIWDTQNNQPMYTINEKALHKRILEKKSQAFHITRFSELLLIIVYTVVTGVIFWSNFTGKRSVFMFILSAWMFAGVIYVLIHRLNRIRGQKHFDRTMLGDLQHALSMANSQVRLARIMRWNTLPMGLLILLSFWGNGISVWLIVATAVFFILVFYASGWENNIYKRKKRELEVLMGKLQQE
jgi:hypothetical protein